MGEDVVHLAGDPVALPGPCLRSPRALCSRSGPGPDQEPSVRGGLRHGETRWPPPEARHPCLRNRAPSRSPPRPDAMSAPRATLASSPTSRGPVWRSGPYTPSGDPSSHTCPTSGADASGKRSGRPAAQLAPITGADITVRAERMHADGVTSIWFSDRPRPPWLGTVPSVPLERPDGEKHLTVAEGLVKFESRSWKAVPASLTQFLNWAFASRIVQHTPRTPMRYGACRVRRARRCLCDRDIESTRWLQVLSLSVSVS